MELRDKICLITGATSGIGKAAAEKIATAGGELILVARNRNRGERVVDDIIRRSANANVKLYNADLSSIREIKELSESIHAEYQRLDVLVNNAGAHYSKFHLTVDGIEASFAVNYLSRFLLSNLLLDLLLNSPSGRIVNITGEYYRRGNTDFNLSDHKTYKPMKAVSQAKFADMIFVMEMARLLKNTNVSVNAMHPGAVGTDIIKNDPDASEFIRFIYSLIKPMLKSPHTAAEDIYYLVFAEELKQMSGKYFCGKEIKEPLRSVKNEETAKRLWELSENLTGYKGSIIKNKSILEK